MKPISIWVLHFIDALPSDGFLRSYELPPPANGEHGFRPLSVLFLKMYLWFFPVTEQIPMLVIFLKVFVSAFALGHATLLWLRERLGVKQALFGALLVVFSAPHLFGLWVLAELDGLGAALVLHALRLWQQKSSSLRQHIVLWGAMASAMLLKESSALMMLASLFSLAVLQLQVGEPPKRALRDVAVLALVWVLWAWEMIGGGRASTVGEAPWSMRFPIIFFTAWQYLYLLSFPGTFLLLIGCLKKELRRRALWAGLGLLILAPPVVWINHYETIYFSPLWWAAVVTLVFYSALLWLALKSSSRAEAEAAWFVLACQGVMWAAILISSSPREDMAARIFLPASAPLIGLLLLQIKKLEMHKKEWSYRLLYLSLLWFFAANAMNTLIERQARDRLHYNALIELARYDLGPTDKILFNNFAYRLSQESLQQLRSQPSPQIVYISDHITDSHFPSIIWGDLLELELRYSQGERFWFFWSAKKMLSEKPELLAGDFSYTRRPMGAFQPLHKTPNDFLPEHNYVEDLRATTYSKGSTNLQNLLSSRGDRRWAARNLYFLFPTHLYELPNRLIRGWPILEWYSYDADLWTVQK